MLGDTLLLIFVTMWTIILMYIPYILGLKQKMIDDWTKYRCNPIILPIAGYINGEAGMSASDSTSQNFQYCTQNIMSSFMDYLLEPLNFITSGLTSSIGELADSAQYIRAVISNIKDFFMTIVEELMGIFSNIIVEFIKIFIGIRDAVGKLVGILLTVVYILEGFSYTGESIVNGVIGDFICFHPDTTILKMDGTKCKMCKLSLGDKIDGNSEIQIILKIKNKTRERFYQLLRDCSNDNGQEKYIYVTGSHLILSNNDNGQEEYIPVEKHPDAKLTDIIVDELYCLVTDNHIIKIGDYIFHDWEDDKEREKYELSIIK